MATVSMMPYPVRYQGYPRYPVYPARPQATDELSSYYSVPTEQQQHLPQQSLAQQQPLSQQPLTQPHLPPQQIAQQQLSQQQHLQAVPHHLQATHSLAQQAQQNTPPLDDKPSLPSISNLLGIADGDRPAHEAAARQYQQMQRAERASPLTPPSIVDRNSPSISGPSLSGTMHTTQPYLVGSALNNLDAEGQRAAQFGLMRRTAQPSMSPYTLPQYTSSPSNVSSASYYSPTDTAYATLYQQRPLPSTFPPSVQPMMTEGTSNLTNSLWEHHHYIPPPTQASYPLPQDRYLCTTCNKSFSRPSSLKIHSHSHTGEKPFKCPHQGCGKAFSVRSNMKRHERGCHPT